MLYTFQNSKNIFLSFLQNNFAWSNGEASSKNVEQEPTDQKHESPTKILLKSIIEDGKINGKDLQKLNALEKSFDNQKSDILENTKENLQASLFETLQKWFTVKNEQDYDTFKIIMKLAGKQKYQLPNFEKVLNEVLKEEDEQTFSLKFKWDDVYVYSDINWVTGASDVVCILKSDWSIEDVGFWKWIFSWEDNNWNNNEIDMEIDGEQLDKNYNEAITQKLEDYKNLTILPIFPWSPLSGYRVKPEKIENLDEQNKNPIEFFASLKKSVNEINEYNKEVAKNNSAYQKNLLDTYQKSSLSILSPLSWEWLDVTKPSIDIPTDSKEITKEIAQDIKKYLEDVNQYNGKVKEANNRYKTSLIDTHNNPQLVTILPGAEKFLDAAAQKPNKITGIPKVQEALSDEQIQALVQYSEDVNTYNDDIEKANEQYKRFSSAEAFYEKSVKAISSEIESIQKALIDKDFPLTQYSADGDFGKETFDALVSFQEQNGLTPDGKAWWLTLSKLFDKEIKTDEFYSSLKKIEGKWVSKKEKKESKPKNQIENLEISQLDGLKKKLENKELAVVDGEYFFLPDTKIENLDAFKKNIEWEEGKEILSLEEVIAQIKATDGIELAIDGWFLNAKLNEQEKLTLVLSALDRKDEKIFDVNTSKEITQPTQKNSFPILDIPRKNFDEGVYTKESFEKSLIKALNKKITDFTQEEGKNLDPKDQKELTKRVNKEIKEWKIDMNVLSAKDIITQKSIWAWSDTAKIEDLVKEKNVFDSLNITQTIEMKWWLFVWVPPIKKIWDDELYKLVNGEETAVLSWKRLKTLFDENQKYEEATINDDERDFDYSEEQTNKDNEKEKEKNEKIEKIKNDIKSEKFSAEDFFGKDISNKELKWLNRFSVGDLKEKSITLNNIKVDLEKSEIVFDFDDDFINDKYNKNITLQGIDLKNFSSQSIRKKVVAEANRVANIVEPTKQEPKKKPINKKEK